TSSRLISNLPSRRLGLTAASLPFRVPRGELADALKAFERLPVRGFSVTIPHKEAAAELAARKDATVEQTLAANTLVRGPDGLGAYNTDYQGVIDALKAFLPAFAQAPRPPADPGAPALTPAPPPQPAEPALASIASKVVLVLGRGAWPGRGRTPRPARGRWGRSPTAPPRGPRPWPPRSAAAPASGTPATASCPTSSSTAPRSACTPTSTSRPCTPATSSPAWSSSTPSTPRSRRC